MDFRLLKDFEEVIHMKRRTSRIMNVVIMNFERVLLLMVGENSLPFDFK